MAAIQKDMVFLARHSGRKRYVLEFFFGGGSIVGSRKIFPQHIGHPISASWVVWVLYIIVQSLWLMGYVKSKFLHGVVFSWKWGSYPKKNAANKKRTCDHLSGWVCTWKPTKAPWKHLVWKEGTASHVAEISKVADRQKARSKQL